MATHNEQNRDEHNSLNEAFGDAALQADSEVDRQLQESLREIAEASLAPPEAIEHVLEEISNEQAKKRTKWGRFVQQIRQMDFATRRLVVSAFLGLQMQLVNVLANVYGDQYGLGLIAMTTIVCLAIYNCALTRNGNLGALTGGAFGMAASVGLAFFSWLFHSPTSLGGQLLIPLTLGCALLGYGIGRIGDKITMIRFQADPQKRREYLLKQLIELQEELKKGETTVTFLSVDVVGSTALKHGADPLAVEYTFNEYTNFVRSIASEFEGTIHSTAGDGIIVTFSHPQQAFLAARKMQAGMLEFNAFRNRIGGDFSLRCGIHTGTVMAARGDASNVNYSHVIDLSAHAQKASPIGGLAITEASAFYLPGGPAALRASRVEVQGHRVLLWQPALSLSNPVPSAVMEAPPPPPVHS